MAGINVGWMIRFMARDTRDVAGFWVNWSSVSVPGTVNGRIETIDATTGKPTGSLYDANATITFTPSVGWEQQTFATLPTTGLTAGVEYALLLITTGVGTTQTLRSHVASGNATAYPATVLTAAVGTVRSNFAEVASSIGIATLVFEDSSEEADGMLPFAAVAANSIYGKNAWGALLTLSTTITLRGVSVSLMLKNGTPGDVRCRIFDSTNTQVANASCTIDKDSLSTSSSNRRIRWFFPAVVTLPPGTYRVILDQTDTTTTSGNNYQIYSGTCRASGLCPSGMSETLTTDVTVGSPTWTNNAAQWPDMQLILDDLPGSGVRGAPIIAMAGDLALVE